MKNILAENLLRFGVKNLKESDKQKLMEQDPKSSTISPQAQAQMDKLISATSSPINTFISTNKITFETSGQPMVITGATLSSNQQNANAKYDLALKLDTTFTNDLYLYLVAPETPGGDLQIKTGSGTTVGAIDRKNVYLALVYDAGTSGRAVFDKYVAGMQKAKELEAAGKPNPLDQIVNLVSLINKQWKSGSMATPK